MGDSLRLRRATMDDADIILEWVNDPLDRANSFDSRMISREEHLAWMRDSLDDPTRFLYILEDDGVPVGHIKLYREGDRADLGYCIAPSCRGRGYARTMLRLLVDAVHVEDAGIKTIVASVKHQNEASIKALLGNGYVEAMRVFELDV